MSDLNPNVLLVIKILCLSLICLFIMAAAGSSLVATVDEILARTRKKVFLDKAGWQASSMGMILALATLPFTVGSWVILFIATPQDSIPQVPLGPAFYLIAGAFFFSLALMLLHRLTWAAMAKLKGLHIALGILTVATLLAVLFLALNLKRTLFLYPVAFVMDPSLGSFFSLMGTIPAGSFFWPLLIQLMALCVCAAGAVGLPYIVVRRSRDDFGRDYYAYAAKHMATWALAGCVFQFPCQTWLSRSLLPLFQANPAQSAMLAYSMIASAACLAIAVFTWFVVRRSKNPLRAKAAMFLGALFLYLGLAAQGWCLSTLFF